MKHTTFKDDEASDYFNEHFINVTLDGEKGEGLSFVKEYGIRGYPSLLVIDGDGHLIARVMGYHRAKEFIAFGKKAMKKWGKKKGKN